jgi:hypothetical protein
LGLTVMLVPLELQAPLAQLVQQDLLVLQVLLVPLVLLDKMVSLGPQGQQVHKAHLG